MYHELSRSARCAPKLPPLLLLWQKFIHFDLCRTMTQEESTSFQPFPDYSSHEEDNEVQPALHFIHQESDTTTNANTANVESRNPFVQEGRFV